MKNILSRTSVNVAVFNALISLWFSIEAYAQEPATLARCVKECSAACLTLAAQLEGQLAEFKKTCGAISPTGRLYQHGASGWNGQHGRAKSLSGLWLGGVMRRAEQS